MVVYVNDRWYSDDKAKISVFDPGLFYSDGVFDTFRIYNGKAWCMKEHLNRLCSSCTYADIEYPGSAKLIKLVKAGYKKSKLVNAFVRIIVTSKSLIVIVMDRKE